MKIIDYVPKGTGVRTLVSMAVIVMLFVGAITVASNGDDSDATVAPWSMNGSTYATLQDAVNSAGTTEVTITLTADASGDGVKIPSGSNITIDYGGYTYTINGKLVGSSGTETNGFQLLKDSNICMKNGLLTTTNALFLIQNYSNLTLEDMKVIGGPETQYVVSNNNGVQVYKGSTEIISTNDDVAFDVCWAANAGYPNGAQLTIDDSFTGRVVGEIKLGSWNEITADSECSVKIYGNGTFDGKITISDFDPYENTGLEIHSGTFSDINAVSSAVDGADISIVMSSDQQSTMVIPEGVTVDLDLNGFTLTNTPGKHTIDNSGTLSITDSSPDGEGTVDNISHGRAALFNNPVGTVVVDGGNFNRTCEAGTLNPDNDNGNSWYVIKNYGDMTINDAKVYSRSGYSSCIVNGYDGVGDYTNMGSSTIVPTLVINNGTYEGGKITVKNDERGMLTINGGVFGGSAGGFTIYNWNEAKINGGSFDDLIGNGFYQGDIGKGNLMVGLEESDSDLEIQNIRTDSGILSIGTVTVKGCVELRTTQYGFATMDIVGTLDLPKNAKVIIDSNSVSKGKMSFPNENALEGYFKAGSGGIKITSGSVTLDGTVLPDGTTTSGAATITVSGNDVTVSGTLGQDAVLEIGKETSIKFDNFFQEPTSTINFTKSDDTTTTDPNEADPSIKMIMGTDVSMNGINYVITSSSSTDVVLEYNGQFQEPTLPSIGPAAGYTISSMKILSEGDVKLDGNDYVPESKVDVGKYNVYYELKLTGPMGSFTYKICLEWEIVPATIDITGSPSKTYDSTTGVESEDIALGSDLITATYEYADKNAGSSKDIIVIFDAGNLNNFIFTYDGVEYAPMDGRITIPGIGTIEKRTLDVTADTTSKVYDGTTLFETFNGDFIPGDAISIAGAFDVKGVSATTITFVVSGADKDNYTTPGSISGTITPLSIIIGVAEGKATKEYDGTVLTVGFNDFVVRGLVSGDSINAGSIATPGTDAGDYTISSSTGLSIVDSESSEMTGNYTPSYDAILTISKKVLTISDVSIQDKVYAGKDELGATVTSVILDGVVDSETFTLGTDYSVSASFEDSIPGTGKTVTVVPTLLDTNLASNYCFTEGYTAEATGNLSALKITLTGDTKTKTYDGTNAHEINGTDNIIEGDAVVITGEYSSVDAGTGLTITYAISGNDAAYYIAPMAVSDASITAIQVEPGMISVVLEERDGNIVAKIEVKSGSLDLTSFTSEYKNSEGSYTTATNNEFIVSEAGEYSVKVTSSSSNWTASGVEKTLNVDIVYRASFFTAEVMSADGLEYSNDAEQVVDLGKKIYMPVANTVPEGMNFIGWKCGEDGTSVIKAGTYYTLENLNVDFYAVYEADTVSEKSQVIIDVPTNFIVGEEAIFSVTTIAGSDGGTMVKGVGTFPEGVCKVWYLENNPSAPGYGEWHELSEPVFGPSSGFPMMDATSYFKVLFYESGNYDFDVEMQNVNGTVLCEASAEIFVLGGEPYVDFIGAGFYNDADTAKLALAAFGSTYSGGVDDRTLVFVYENYGYSGLTAELYFGEIPVISDQMIDDDGVRTWLLSDLNEVEEFQNGVYTVKLLNGETVLLEKNIQVVLDAEAVTYKVTLSGGYGTNFVTAGESMFIPALSNEGMVFMGWYDAEVDGNLIIKTGYYTPTSDVTLYPVFKDEVSFDVTTSYDGSDVTIAHSSSIVQGGYGIVVITKINPVEYTVSATGCDLLSLGEGSYMIVNVISDVEITVTTEVLEAGVESFTVAGILPDNGGIRVVLTPCNEAGLIEGTVDMTYTYSIVVGGVTSYASATTVDKAVAAGAQTSAFDLEIGAGQKLEYAYATYTYGSLTLTTVGVIAQAIPVSTS